MVLVHTKISTYDLSKTPTYEGAKHLIENKGSHIVLLVVVGGGIGGLCELVAGGARGGGGGVHAAQLDGGRHVRAARERRDVAAGTGGAAQGEVAEV